MAHDRDRRGPGVARRQPRSTDHERTTYENDRSCHVDIAPGAERIHRDTGLTYCPSCARKINTACGQELVTRPAAVHPLSHAAERTAARLRACPYILDADSDDCRGLPLRWRVRDGQVEVAADEREDFHPVTEAVAALVVAGAQAGADAYNAALADGDQHLAAERYAHLEPDHPSDAGGL